MPPDAYKDLVMWVLPPVLGFAVRYLQQIAKKLSDISVSLAIVVRQIESHEHRLTMLEDMQREHSKRSR